MSMNVDRETELVKALQLTAEPPRAWIEAAALIPSTLGELDQLETLLEDPGFRERFAHDPLAAVRDAGLPESEPVLAALRARLS